jgi:hypothetical protein
VTILEAISVPRLPPVRADCPTADPDSPPMVDDVGGAPARFRSAFSC